MKEGKAPPTATATGIGANPGSGSARFVRALLALGGLLAMAGLVLLVHGFFGSGSWVTALFDLAEPLSDVLIGGAMLVVGSVLTVAALLLERGPAQS